MTPAVSKDPDELEVHARVWQPLASRLSRKLTPGDAREIRRNLAALLLSLKEADDELKAAVWGDKEPPDEPASAQ